MADLKVGDRVGVFRDWARRWSFGTLTGRTGKVYDVSVGPNSMVVHQWEVLIDGLSVPELVWAPRVLSEEAARAYDAETRMTDDG